MASNDITQNMSVPQAPPETPDLDDEESFIVLGQSPSSFSLDEQSNAYSILQDALKSFDHQTVTGSQKDEASIKVENDEKELETLKESVSDIKLDETDTVITTPVQEKNLSLATIVSDLSVEEIQSKVESIVEENTKLKETIMQNNIAMKKQYDTIMKWQEEVQIVHNQHKTKFNRTRSYIEELQQQIVGLNEVVKKSQQKIDDLNSDSQAALAKLKEKDDTKFDMEAARQTNESLKKRIEELKELLERREENKTTRNEEMENVRQQLMNAQMHITELEQAGAKYRDVINDQQQEIAELKMKSVVNNPVTDEVSVLRAQLDIFKADFDAEVNAKQMYVTRCQQLSEDLANLQRRNHQLIEEIERLRGNSFEHVEPLASAPPQKEYVCPKCNFKFDSYAILENHVFRCIELDSVS